MTTKKKSATKKKSIDKEVKKEKKSDFDKIRKDVIKEVIDGLKDGIRDKEDKGKVEKAVDEILKNEHAREILVDVADQAIDELIKILIVAMEGLLSQDASNPLRGIGASIPHGLDPWGVVLFGPGGTAGRGVLDDWREKWGPGGRGGMPQPKPKEPPVGGRGLPKGWGGRRPGAGRPKGARNRG